MLPSLFAMLLFSNGAHAFRFEDLKALAAQKTSVEETVAALPKDIRANYILMHRSRSIQGGSPENPRAILFNDDASMVMTFTGDTRGSDHIEVMTFDKDRFAVKTIRFPNGQAQVNEAPQNCFGCHGTINGDLKPVWDPGLVWRGAYGSHDDTFSDPATIDEADAYARFVTNAPSLYRGLDLAHRVGAGDRHQIENRPNLRLGLLLMRQQAKRIARLMAPGSLKKFCAPSLAPRSLRIDVALDVALDDVKVNLERFMTPIYGSAFTQDFLQDEAPSIADALSIARDAGVDEDEIPLTVQRRTNAVFDASFRFRDLLFAEVAKREAGQSLQFKSLTESRLNMARTPGLEAVDAIGEPLTSASVKSLCEL